MKGNTSEEFPAWPAENPAAADPALFCRIEEVLALLQEKLRAFSGRLRSRLVSVQLDGSYVRGDFLTQASDLDLTVTLEGAQTPEDAAEDHHRLADFFSFYSLPQRPTGARPLFLDIQWQTIDEVRATAARKAADWSADNVPAGYPKLWLYAFDQRRHHRILFGEDLTSEYTALPPAFFAPLRLTRIRRAALRDGEGVTPYDRAHGTVTQMKHAWEAVRAAVLWYGGTSLCKQQVWSDFGRLVPHFSGRELLADFPALYQMQPTSSSGDGDKVFVRDFSCQKHTTDFRRKLFFFTISLLEQLGFMSEESGSGSQEE